MTADGSDFKGAGMNDFKDRIFDAAKGEFEFQHKPWRPWVMAVTLLVLTAGAGASAISWFLTYITGTDSLSILIQQYMDSMQDQVSGSMTGRMRPLKINLQQGYEFAYQAELNFSNWSTHELMESYSFGFISNYLDDTRCCTGLFSHMDYFGYNEKGERNELWDNANEDHYGSDAAKFSGVIYDPNGSHFSIYGMYTEGHRSNPTVIDPFDPQTGRIRDPNRFPVGEVGDRINMGFAQYPKFDAHWYYYMLKSGIKECEFTFTPIFVWVLNEPKTLKIHGEIPIYEPSCGCDSKRRTKQGDLTFCDGVEQKRVGAWIMGFKLHWFSTYLASLNLKGGFLYFVERKSGYFIAGSDSSISSLKEDTSTDPPTYSPIEASSPDMPSQRVRELTDWVLNQREGRLGTWDDVSNGKELVTLGGVRQFTYVFSYTEFGTDWVAVMSIPWDNVMADIDATKERTLILGIVLSIVIKVFVMSLQHIFKYTAARKILWPSVHKAIMEVSSPSMQEQEASETQDPNVVEI